MGLSFEKYHGTGNDFIMIDHRGKHLSGLLDQDYIAFLCDRHFGIGADGLILLEHSPVYDFRMVYYNSDGRQSSMCGNGGRCLVAFAAHLGVISHTCTFEATDGLHEAALLADGNIALGMQPVPFLLRQGTDWILNTGSPHYVRFLDRDIDSIDVVKEGQTIRNSPPFAADGINVNFVSCDQDGIRVRTYERGVEDETLSCGTGVTAAAIAFAAANDLNGPQKITVDTKGGRLRVAFNYSQGKTTDVQLIGPATRVFSGSLPGKQL